MCWASPVPHWSLLVISFWVGSFWVESRGESSSEVTGFFQFYFIHIPHCISTVAVLPGPAREEVSGKYLYVQK